MKFRVTMKDPDTLGDAIDDAVRAELKTVGGLTDNERETLLDDRRDAVKAVTAKWFEWGEYVTIEIDTDANSATVIAK